MNASNATGDTSVICSHDLPLSSDFFRHLSSAEKAMMGLCTLLALVTLIDHVEQVSYILRRYQTNVAVKYTSIEILGVCPVVSLISLTALFVPRAQLVCQLASSVYVSWCIYNFVSLMILYLSGTENIICRLKDSRIHMREPPCCCCCCCLPELAVTVKNIRVMRALVLQNAILQPPMTFITLVLWTDGKYKEGQLFSDNGFPYLTAVSVVSSLLSLYGLMVFFKFCKAHLRPAFIVAKFVALQLVILFCQLQDSVFSILARFDIPACTGTFSSEVRGQAYLQMALVIQMFLLSLLGRYLYRHPHNILSTLSLDRPPSSGHQSQNIDKVEYHGQGLTLQTYSNQNIPELHTNSGGFSQR